MPKTPTVKDMSGKKEEYVMIPSELLKKVDELVRRLNFGSREAFVQAAIRRLIDYYTILQPSKKEQKV